MASKKRKSGTKPKTRRRKMGAVSKLTNPANPLVKYGAVAIGYFMADKINEGIDKLAGDKMDGKLLAGLQTFAGLVGAQIVPVIKMKPNLILTIAGGALAGAGLKRGLSEFGVINGFHNVPALAGFRDVPALGAYNPTPGANLSGFNPTPAKVMGSVPGSADATEGSGINLNDR